MKTNIFFKCPECESEKIKDIFHYKDKNDKGLYSSVLNEIQCGSCYMDIPSHLGERKGDISFEQAKEQWHNRYKPEHLKNAAKCSVCNLLYYEIEKILGTDTNQNIFLQKFTKIGNPDLICRICEPKSFK